MVGTWLLELYLDQLNRSLLEVKGQPTTPGTNGNTPKADQGSNGTLKAVPAPDQLTQDLRAFLQRNVDVLDVNVTVSLLAGYGRLDDLMEYATYRKVGICQAPLCARSHMHSFFRPLSWGTSWVHPRAGLNWKAAHASVLISPQPSSILCPKRCYALFACFQHWWHV